MKNEKEIIKRAMAMTLISRRCLDEFREVGGVIRNQKTRQDSCKELRKWIEEKELLNIFTNDEKDIIYTNVGDNPGVVTWAFLAHDAIEPLLWTVGLADMNTPIYIRSVDHYEEVLPTMTEDFNLEEVGKGAKLRDRKEIEKKRDLAMLWQWRAIEGKQPIFKHKKLKAIIEKTFQDDELTKLADEIKTGKWGKDFWIEKIPFRVYPGPDIKNVSFHELPEEEMKRIQYVAEWKQKSLEWVLCDDDWDDVSADT